MEATRTAAAARTTLFDAAGVEAILLGLLGAPSAVCFEVASWEDAVMGLAFDTRQGGEEW